MSKKSQDVPIFVDEHARVITGQAAAGPLAERAVTFDPEQGIVAVERPRWEEAQRYERSSWLERGRRMVDDRNQAHLARFAGYGALRGQTFRRAIELGCGPFTNMRLILEVIRADEVELLDPLATDYQQHAFCRYRTGRLGGVARMLQPAAWSAVVKPARYAGEIANAHRVGGWTGRRVRLHATGIEDFQPEGTYDLVVMINVLEHCRDARAVFEKIAAMLEPGGVFVYADKVFEAEQLARLSGQYFDAGHPLLVDHRLIDGWLGRDYDVMMRAFYESSGRGPSTGDLYFVGRRRGPVANEDEGTPSPA